MYKRYFAIEKKLKNQGINMSRSELIETFTEGKKSGLTELSPREYNEFIQWLNRLKSQSTQQDWQNTPENKMRRKIISLFKKMNYITTDNRANMPAINNWCKKYGYLHKELNAYTITELPKLVSQVERVYQTFVDAL